jgi:DNA polymerase-3 subunit chi
VTQVDFYVLPAEDTGQRNLFACRLAEKAFREGHNVYLHAADEASGQALDELLWGFRPQSFVPHGLLGSEDAERVAIGWGTDPGEHHGVMINLDITVPDFVGRFERVLEIVVQDPAIRDPLRDSWKRYKHFGYPLEKHDL